jgi:hypothetical protein
MGNELSQHLGVGENAVPDCCEARHEDQTVMHAVGDSWAHKPPPTHAQKKAMAMTNVFLSYAPLDKNAADPVGAHRLAIPAVLQQVKAAKESSPTRSQTKQQPHGVGLVFQTGRDGKMVVSSFIRDSSAYESGLVKTGGKLQISCPSIFKVDGQGDPSSPVVLCDIPRRCAVRRQWPGSGQHTSRIPRQDSARREEHMGAGLCILPRPSCAVCRAEDMGNS